jgi:putative hydrolase of the HAD superfamily
MTAMRVKGLIFDWGNTLVDVDIDWVPVREGGRRSMAEHLGSHWDIPDPAGLVGRFVEVRREYRERSLEEEYEYDAMRALVEALRRAELPDPGEERRLAALDAFFTPEVERLQPFPGALSTLKTLHERGYLLGMISNNTWGPAIRRTLARIGVDGLLSPQLHSSEVGFRKPDPTLFRMVLQAWGLAASEVAMVGDKRDRDILGALRVGMRSIWVRVRAEAVISAAARACVPDAEVHSLPELLDLLD